MDFVAASPVLFRANISRPDASALDPTSLLRWVTGRLPQDSLLELGEGMLRQSRRDNQPLSLLVFELDDLPELEVVFGQRLTRTVLAKTTAALRCLATSKGLATWTTPTIFTAVVPGVTGDRVAAALEATLGPACCIEFEEGEDEILLVPEFRAQTVGAAESLQQAYDTACRDITKARIDRQRRQHYLTRERESHSRPAQLQAATTSSSAQRKRPIDVRAYPPMPATIPVPFAL